MFYMNGPREQLVKDYGTKSSSSEEQAITMGLSAAEVKSLYCARSELKD